MLNHILTEIPESVMPLRREYRTEYGIALLQLGDEKKAKEVLDASVKENIQFAKFFKKLAEGQEGNGVFERELSNSQYFINRAVEFATSKNKMAWAADYKRQSAGLF